MKSSQDIQKEIDYVMNFAEQMGVPDDVYFQFIAVADSYLRDGDYERAEQQVSQALLAAQSYGLKSEGTMRITESKLRRIIRKTLQEGVYEKLNNDATETSSNLDQEVHFGLEEDVIELCKKYADDLRYAQYGVTLEDIFEELKHVVNGIDISYYN